MSGCEAYKSGNKPSSQWNVQQTELYAVWPAKLLLRDKDTLMRFPYVLLTALILLQFSGIGAEVTQTAATEPIASETSALVTADYVLPAYVSLTTATLLVRATGAFKGTPVELRVAFQPRQGGAAPCAEMRATWMPGEERRLTVDIAGWADGDYRTDIQCSRDGQQLGDPLVRWLRKQTIPAPPPAAEPIDVRVLTTLFVDDEYIHAQNGLRRAVNPAEPFAVTTARMCPDRPEQKPVGGIRLDADGTWVVKFTDMEREDRNGTTTRHYTARSREARSWTVEEDKADDTKTNRVSQAEAPRSKAVLVASFAAASEATTPQFRYYDAATDGPVNLRQIDVRHTGYARNVRWGDLEMPFRSVFPVWEKPSGEHLILTRAPLVADKHDHPDGAPCDWRDTNDNFMNDFLSPDGRTIFFGQSRMILRHDPFRVPFDVVQAFRGGHYNRIMVVWRSQDGVQWAPTFFDPQREDDPFSYQGYGAKVFYVEGKRLSLCYFFAYRAQLQQICVELRYSRDNIHWHRLPGRLDDTVFAANGLWGSWNFGYMFGVNSAPVEKDGEMFQLFDTCQNVPHHFFRYLLGYNSKTISDPQWLRDHFADNNILSYPFWKDMGGWEGFARQAPTACRTIGGMRYRKDGWVALKPAEREGELVTKVLAAGEHLAINARTRPGGRVLVEVLDAESRPLPDFSGANAASLTGDSVDARLLWNNGAQPTLPRQSLRLRIKLNQADLFALHWR
jgi:hypothetical protein